MAWMEVSQRRAHWLNTMNSSYWMLVKACNKVLKISTILLVPLFWLMSELIQQMHAQIKQRRTNRLQNMAAPAHRAPLPPLEQQQQRNLSWKAHPAPLIYGTLMMKAVTQASGPNPTPPTLCKGRPLRLISSFTQWQSGDMIRQLFAANRAAPQQHKEHFIRTAG